MDNLEAVWYSGTDSEFTLDRAKTIDLKYTVSPVKKIMHVQIKSSILEHDQLAVGIPQEGTIAFILFGFSAVSKECLNPTIR